jgi:hypothetical protein
MKKKWIVFYSTILLLFGCSSYQHDENEITDMLREFYVAYNTAWVTERGQVLVGSLDSLKEKYCTENFRMSLDEQFENHGLDHDILINDFYADLELLNSSLSVTKDKDNINAYFVSYAADIEESASNPANMKVTIHVFVEKEGDTFKISDVK